MSNRLYDGCLFCGFMNVVYPFGDEVKRVFPEASSAVLHRLLLEACKWWHAYARENGLNWRIGVVSVRVDENKKSIVPRVETLALGANVYVNGEWLKLRYEDLGLRMEDETVLAQDWGDARLFLGPGDDRFTFAWDTRFTVGYDLIRAQEYYHPRLWDSMVCTAAKILVQVHRDCPWADIARKMYHEFGSLFWSWLERQLKECRSIAEIERTMEDTLCWANLMDTEELAAYIYGIR